MSDLFRRRAFLTSLASIPGLVAFGSRDAGAQASPPQQAAPNGVTDETNVVLRAEPAPGGAGALRAMFAELGPTPGGESEAGRLARVKELAQQPDAARPDGVTGLETLEADLASSGFQRMETGQGMLASIAAGASVSHRTFRLSATWR